MPYSQFDSIGKVKSAFGISTVEGVRFFPQISPCEPFNILCATLSSIVIHEQNCGSGSTYPTGAPTFGLSVYRCRDALLFNRLISSVG